MEMQDIIFRGKSVDNDRWVYGSLEVNNISETTYIKSWGYNHQGEIDCVEYEVDPNTIGQYTGIENTNGEQIFDGDIVLVPQYARFPGECETGIVLWDDDSAMFKIGFDKFDRRFDEFPDNNFEVIGNIYDNKKLAWDCVG